MAIIGTLPVTFTDGNTLFAQNLIDQFNAVKTDVNTNAVSKSDSGQTVSANLTFSGGFTLAGNVTVTASALKIIAGATSISFRNNADGADNLLIADSGAVTFRAAVTGITSLTCSTIAGTPNFSGTPTFGAGLTVTAGTVNLGSGALSTGALTVGGNLTFSGTARKLLASASGWDIRNSGDSFSLFSLASGGGSVTIGAGVNYDVILGGQGIATNASAGFVLLPSCAGTPTGAATNGSVILDSTNEKLYARVNGAWKSVTFA